MNLPLYIAKRYFISKKSQNVINIISGISVVGLAVGSMALIVILSVFNGFDEILKSLYNSFNPDLQITIKEGKTFTIDSLTKIQIQNHPGILNFSEIVEENALLKYDEKQYIARLKGVNENFINTTGIDSMIVDGDFILEKNNISYAVIGRGVAYFLEIGLQFLNPIIIYMPKRTGKITIDPTKSFKRKYIYPSGIFEIQQDFDSKYVIIPIAFMRDLLDYTNEVTSIELKLNKQVDEQKTKNDIKQLFGDDFNVKDRYEQNEVFYRIMKSEKWAIYFILTFILIVASFNIIGSSTMLILEKKKDIAVLQSLGANQKLIRRIFFFEGWIISIIGGILGLILGSAICWAQQTYGIIKLQGSGAFIIDSYPVNLIFSDILIVFLIVLLIGMIAAIVPSRYITRKYFSF